MKNKLLLLNGAWIGYVVGVIWTDVGHVLPEAKYTVWNAISLTFLFFVILWMGHTLGELLSEKS